MNDSGYFISFEGIDRSGKSTQAAALAEALGEPALLVREPGGTDLGEHIRTLLKDPTIPFGARPEAMLFAAARAELVAEVIRPALEAGRVVIADRFVDSSLAYQGAARGLGDTAITHLNNWGTDNLAPDLTLLIDVAPEIAIARGVEPGDRFEDQGAGFQRDVALAFESLAAREPHRIVTVDGAREASEVAAEVLGIVNVRMARADDEQPVEPAE